MSEKTHQPTAKKLRDARKNGQVARSKLFSSAFVTFGGVVGALVALPDAWQRLQRWTRSLLSLDHGPFDPRALLLDALELLARAAGLPLLGALFAALIASVLTAGLQLNVELVAPDFNRLNFIDGAKKLFSVKQLIEVGKGLLVTAIIGAVLWNAVSQLGPAAFTLTWRDGNVALPVLLSLWSPVLVKAVVVLLLLGVADQALAHRRHVKDLMMSHDEVKQEHKNSEGDPHHKSHRKAMHKQLASGGPARGVKAASAVVVNPTHIAVALRYAEDECDAPYIVAKAREEDALKLKKEALELGIPVVRDVPLARTLVNYEVGEVVPEELYQAAAAVLSVALDVTQQETAKSEENES